MQHDGPSRIQPGRQYSYLNLDAEYHSALSYLVDLMYEKNLFCKLSKIKYFDGYIRLEFSGTKNCCVNVGHVHKSNNSLIDFYPATGTFHLGCYGKSCKTERRFREEKLPTNIAHETCAEYAGVEHGVDEPSVDAAPNPGLWTMVSVNAQRLNTVWMPDYT